MTTNEMIIKIEELKELEALIEEAKNEAEAIKDDLKNVMDANGVEEMNVGQYVVRFTSVLSSRFNAKLFKDKFGSELYKTFCTEVSSHRFSIA